MLLVSKEKLSDGSRQGVNTYTPLRQIPAGFIEVPAGLAEEAWSYLPYLEITIEDGKVTAVAQGEIPEFPEPEKPEEPAEELSVWDELDAAYREGVNSI